MQITINTRYHDELRFNKVKYLLVIIDLSVEKNIEPTYFMVSCLFIKNHQKWMAIPTDEN